MNRVISNIYFKESLILNNLAGKHPLMLKVQELFFLSLWKMLITENALKSKRKNHENCYVPFSLGSNFM